MAYAPFAVKRPGIEHGRILPQAFEPAENDAVLMLGVESEGWVDRAFAIDDMFEAYQSDSKGTADVVRFANRVRAPSTMPAVSAEEPFTLLDGQTLIVAVDGGSPQTITFSTGDFLDIGNARATEVQAVIAGALTGAVAHSSGTGHVVLTSSTTGRHSRVEAVGGTAVLGFTELAWFVELVINGVVMASKRMLTGEVRTFTDWTANLAAFADPVEIRFRLLLGAVT